MPALATDISKLYISENACPFEGCTYGKWHVQKETTVYTDQSIKSQVIGKLKPATTVMSLTGNVHVVPGKAKIIGEPYHESPGLDHNKMSQWGQV